jgi:Orange carotenoid protein, N-terminal
VAIAQSQHPHQTVGSKNKDFVVFFTIFNELHLPKAGSYISFLCAVIPISVVVNVYKRELDRLLFISKQRIIPHCSGVIMTYTTDNKTKQALESFKQFDADTQLALLWYGYLDIKDQLHPAPPNDVEVTSKAVFDQIQALSQEEQLQAQRDIVNCLDNQIGQTYSALSPSSKLELWLMLAQGMEESSIIGVPSDYKLPSETDNFVEQIKGLEFEERVNFMKSTVVAMGAKPMTKEGEIQGK